MEIESTSLSMLSGIRRGDNHAWRRFYERYRVLVFLTGKRLRLQPVDIDILMSNVLCKFFDKAGQFQYDATKGRFRDYFACVVRNAAMDIIRERNKQVAHGIGAGEPEQTLLDIPDEDFIRQMHNDEELALVGEAFRIIRAKLPVRAIQSWMACRLQRRPAVEVSKFNRTSLATVYNDCALVGKALLDCVAQLRQGEYVEEAEEK